MKMTEWFPAEVKPVHKGIYETNATPDGSWQYWTGEFWGLQNHECRMISVMKYKSYYQSVQWRGLAEPPK